MKQSTHHKSLPGYLQRIFLLGILAGIFFVVAFWGSSCTQVTTPPVNGEPDTTSHDFTFETFVFGDGGSSTLYDVAIVNDTLAYAVGEIFLKDSTGHVDPTAYSYAIWDGVNWELRRLYDNGLLIAPIRGLFFVSSKDIWLAAGSIYQWDGSNSEAQLRFSRLALSNPNATIEKLLGTSSVNLFGVGNSGTIVHYNGGSWQKIESGTIWDFRDISRFADPFSGKETVISVASSTNGVKFLSLSQNSACDTLPWQVNNQIGSIWVTNQFKVYAAGSGIWKHDGLIWQQVDSLPAVFYNKVRGTKENNIFVAGRDVLAHYNGASWHVYQSIPSDFRLKSIAVSKNMVITVGQTVTGQIAGNAAIVVGKRQN